jgi:hypothetical protein
MTCCNTFEVVKNAVIGGMIESINGTDLFFAWKFDHHIDLGQEMLVAQLRHFRRALQKSPANFSNLLCTPA